MRQSISDLTPIECRRLHGLVPGRQEMRRFAGYFCLVLLHTAGLSGYLHTQAASSPMGNEDKGAATSIENVTSSLFRHDQLSN
jgi:hypothetical protein